MLKPGQIWINGNTDVYTNKIKIISINENETIWFDCRYICTNKIETNRLIEILKEHWTLVGALKSKRNLPDWF